jgi:hypothetical protein
MIINTEQGKSYSFLPSREKQLLTVKKYITKAFDKILIREWTLEEKSYLTQLRDFADNATSSAELLDIIEKSMKIINK